MPFVLKKFKAVEGKKIQQFLIDDAGLNISNSQKMLAKGRVFDENNKVLQNGQKVKGEFIQVAMFEGSTRGLKPILNTPSFAIFDKPSGVMVHPTSRNTQYTLLDEIRYHFGDSANLAHRIDQETSGLVLVTKNKYSDMILKEMFESKQYKKNYLAIVDGKVDKNITIDSGIKKAVNSKIGVKMTTSSDGKESMTYIKPLKYDSKKNQTLVEATPITGRQHQIRVHLDSIGHRIVGDPIYGIDEDIADLYLLKKLEKDKRIEATGYKRLLLHANYLEFTFEDIVYKIYS
ncbi:MAG: RluA family pseudouridine synthase, partial [Campylobacterota bacterium]|nr:RluA family pseudouridine synthase [Campylobacterota bacterium]